MIRSDYCLPVPTGAIFPGPPPRADASLRRPLARARDAAHADAARRGRGAGAWRCSAASRARARAAWCASSPASASAERALVLYGACDAVVRTPYGPFVEALDQLARRVDPAGCAPTSARRRRAHPAAARPARPDRRAARAGRPTRTPSATGSTPRSPTCSPASAGPAAAARARGRPLGRHADAVAAAPPGALGRRTRACSLLATFRDTEADVPPALAETLADLRRSEDVVRLRLGGLSRRRGREFVRARRRREAGPELDRAGRDDRASSPAATRSSSASSGAPCSRRGSVEVGGRRAPRHPPARRARQPRERARGRRPAALQARAATDELLELAATAGAEFELDAVRRAAGLAEPELLAALDEAVAQRHDRGAAVRRALLPLHPRARAPRALRRPLAGPAGGAAPARRRGARGRRTRDPDARLADLAHHFAAAAPLGGAERAVELQPARGTGGRRRRSPSTRPPPPAHRARARVDDPRERAEAFLELGTASHRAGQGARRSRGVRAGGRIARELGDAELLARAAIGYEDACWRPGIDDARRIELLEEALAALGDGDPELRVGLLAGLARALDFQRRAPRAARSSAATRSPWRAASATARAGQGAGALLLVAGDELARGDPRDAQRGTRSGRGAGRRPRSAPRRWPGGCRPSSRSATSSPPGARWPRCARRPSGRRSRSCSMSPSTTARRSRSATAASPRPRRGAPLATSGAGC